MEEMTLSGQNGATIQTWPLKLRNLLRWKAILLSSLAAVCTVVFFFAFQPRPTTPPQTSFAEQKTHRTSYTSPHEQNRWDSIVQEMIAEGKLTPYPPGSPEAQQSKPATPMTPKERIKHYEDVVTNILN